MASEVTGGAAIVLQAPGGSPLRATAIAALDIEEERALRLAVDGATMPDALGIAFSEADPRLAPAHLPAAWRAWVEGVQPVESLVLPIAHGEHRVAWLWIGARLSPDGLDRLRDLVAVAAMRHTLVTDPVDHSVDTLDLEARLSHRDDELEAAHQTVDALAEVVGRDVREAFRELLGLSRLSADADDALRIELLQKIRVGVERIGGMLGDLLEDVAEAQADRRDVVAVDLNGAVAWAGRVLADQISDRGAVLFVDTLPTIRTSPTVVRRVVLELVRNAIDHGGRGIHVSCAEASDGMDLLIEDDGPGIPEADREIMFSPGTSTSTGSGMGLTRARLLAEQVGGTVNLEASSVGGVRARVFLPQAPRGA